MFDLKAALMRQECKDSLQVKATQAWQCSRQGCFLAVRNRQIGCRSSGYSVCQFYQDEAAFD